MKTYRLLNENPMYREFIASDSSWIIREGKNDAGYSVKPCFRGLKKEPIYAATSIEALKACASALEADKQQIQAKIDEMNAEIVDLEQKGGVIC